MRLITRILFSFAAQRLGLAEALAEAGAGHGAPASDGDGGSGGAKPPGLVQIAAQFTRALRAPQFLLGARFDLPDAFARQAERVADFLQRA
jgi:hypothetical protein